MTIKWPANSCSYNISSRMCMLLAKEITNLSRWMFSPDPDWMPEEPDFVHAACWSAVAALKGSRSTPLSSTAWQRTDSNITNAWMLAVRWNTASVFQAVKKLASFINLLASGNSDSRLYLPSFHRYRLNKMPSLPMVEGPEHVCYRQAIYSLFTADITSKSRSLKRASISLRRVQLNTLLQSQRYEAFSTRCAGLYLHFYWGGTIFTRGIVSLFPSLATGLSLTPPFTTGHVGSRFVDLTA